MTSKAIAAAAANSTKPSVAAGLRLDQRHDQRREEPAEPAGGADDAGDGADAVREPLGNELEDGTGAEPEEHGDRQAGDRQRTMCS